MLWYESIFHFDFLVLAREQANYAAHIRFMEKVFDKKYARTLSSELNKGKWLCQIILDKKWLCVAIILVKGQNLKV